MTIYHIAWNNPTGRLRPFQSSESKEDTSSLLGQQLFWSPFQTPPAAAPTTSSVPPSTMMKTVAALALLGSAAAFAPCQEGRTSTAVAANKFASDFGAMAPVSLGHGDGPWTGRGLDMAAVAEVLGRPSRFEPAPASGNASTADEGVAKAAYTADEIRGQGYVHGGQGCGRGRVHGGRGHGGRGRC